MCSDRPTTLLRYSLSSQSVFSIISLPSSLLRAVSVVNGLLCCIFEEDQDLWVLSGVSLIPLKSHFVPITALSAYQGQLITGSKDRTLRVWAQKGNQLAPCSKLHILAAHTDTIVFLLAVEPFLFSSAEDGWLLVWRGVEVWARKKFDEVVTGVVECAASGQFAVWSEGGVISIVSGRGVREGRVDVNRVIKDRSTQKILELNEIDDSFLQIIGEATVEVA